MARRARVGGRRLVSRFQGGGSVVGSLPSHSVPSRSALRGAVRCSPTRSGPLRPGGTMSLAVSRNELSVDKTKKKKRRELTEEQRQEIKDAFELFDTDKDRAINYHELKGVYGL